MPRKDLRTTLVNETLIAVLPATLKATIDSLLQRGVSRHDILSRVRRAQGRRGLATLAVEAYLADRLSEPQVKK